MSVNWPEVIGELEDRKGEIDRAIEVIKTMVHPLTLEIDDEEEEKSGTRARASHVGQRKQFGTTDAIMQALHEPILRTSIELTDRVEEMVPGAPRQTIQSQISYLLKIGKITKDEDLKIHRVVDGRIV